MMKRALVLLLFVAAVCFSCLGATPEKPYPDLADGDTLSATWLIGTFNVLYNWAQAMHSNFQAHIAATSGAHGLPHGSVFVGASETQTLTNKTLLAPILVGGSLFYGTGTIILPASSTPSQTAEGSIVWNGASDLLTVGTGAGRKTMADTDSAQTLTNKTISGGSVLSALVNGGSLLMGTGTLVLPYGTTPAQTAEGSAFWDSDDDLLTVGTGAGRKTMADTNSAQTLTNKTLDSTNSIAGEAIKSGIVAEARIDAAIARDSEVTSAISSHNVQSAHGCSSIASTAALAAHSDSSTGVHGVGAGVAVVGASTTQTLTNKTMGAGCTWQGNVIASGYLDLGGTGAYDIAGFIPGLVPGGSLTCFVFVAPRTINLPSGLSGSYAKSMVAASANTSFSIYKNSTLVATMTFSGTTGTFSMPSSQTLAPGDVWKIVGPSTSDETLADISFTFKGSY